MLKRFANRIAYKIRRKLNYKKIVLNGIRLNTDPDFVPRAINKALLEKKYESEELELVHASIEANDRVLEIGAGIGFIGIACARICGEDNILSYEPNPAMKPVIEANYALNAMRPNLRNRAVATQSGETDFFFSDAVLSSSLIDRQQGNATRVEADAISDVIGEFQPTAIVMDAEGAEIDLLRACDLENVSTIVVEMHPHVTGNDAVSKLCDYLQGLGFRKNKQKGKTSLFEKGSEKV